MSDDKIITPQKFMDELRRFQKGSVTRRHFLGVTGLGLATAVLGSAVPGLRPRKAYAALSGTVNLTTWPNYHSQENLDAFTKKTGVAVNMQSPTPRARIVNSIAGSSIRRHSPDGTRSCRDSGVPVVREDRSRGPLQPFTCQRFRPLVGKDA